MAKRKIEEVGAAQDPQNVTEYVKDIEVHLRATEHRWQPNKDFMQRQQDINETMRGIVVNWLVKVHFLYLNMQPATLFLAINLFDRFLSTEQVAREQLHLIGVTALLLASKYHEMYAPDPHYLAHLMDNRCTAQQILDTEISMLNTLAFRLTIPSPLEFLGEFHKVCNEVCPIQAARSNALSQYLLELGLFSVEVMRQLPSKQAAAAIFAARDVLEIHPTWPQELARQCGYAKDEVVLLANKMQSLRREAEWHSRHAPRVTTVVKFAMAERHEVAFLTGR